MIKKEMKKICIIDSYSWKHFHETFNASFLAECMFISKEVIYFSGTSALRSLKHIMGDRDLKNITFRNIPVIDGYNKICTLLRFILSTIINCWLLIKIDKNDIIIYNYNNVFSLPLINIINKLIKKSIVIVCHGEFEIFNQSFIKVYTLFWRLYLSILKKYFTCDNIRIANGIIFLVLGDNIKNNLSKYISNILFKKLYSIDHSYIGKPICFENKNINSVFRFGIIGQVRKGKNISDVVLLAKNLSSEISDKKIELSIAGSVTTSKEELKLIGINVTKGKKLLTREEYISKINALDYALFFYNSNMYKFTASGPFFDVLVAGKPIFALKNNYFEYMFKKYGDFGILFDSIDDMIVLIRELVAGKRLPFFDFNNIQDQLKPETIALQLKKVLEDAGIYR